MKRTLSVQMKFGHLAPLFFSRKRRQSALALLLALFSIPVFAQQPSDIEISTTTKNAHCTQDGEVSIHIKKKPGVPYEIRSITYDLRDDQNHSYGGTGTGSYVLNYTFHNLKAGKYKAYARITFKNNTTINVGPKEARITSDYKQPTVAIKMERKTLRHYKRNGHRAYTGIISVRVHGGNRPPYNVKVIDMPSEYNKPKNKKSSTLTPGKTVYFYDLPEGTYKFQVTDDCGGLEVQTIKMEEVKHDVPFGDDGHGSHVKLPFERDAYSSTETRRHCRWFFYRYRALRPDEWSSKDEELLPYLAPRGKDLSETHPEREVSPRDTVAKYYEYGWAYNDAKPTHYYPVGTAPFQAGKDAGDKNKIEEVYGKIPEGKNWGEVGYDSSTGTVNKALWPALFFRLKDATTQEIMPKGYRARKLLINERPEYTRFTNRWFSSIEPCSTDFYLNVGEQIHKKEMFCYPIKTELLDKNKNHLKHGKEIKGPNESTNFNNYRCKAGEQYFVKATDGSGWVHIFEVRLRPEIQYGIDRNLQDKDELDWCAGKRSSAIHLKRLTPFLSDFRDNKITFLSAPTGYQPAEDGFAVGEIFRVPHTSDKIEILYPFGKRSENFAKAGRHIFAPPGKYVFKVEACGKTYHVEYDLKATCPKYTTKLENFRPRVTNSECGRIRIYPFTAENKTNLIFKDGVADPRPFVYIKKYPEGVEKKDIRHNLPSGDKWAWDYHDAILFVDNNGFDPKELYLDFPKGNGEVTLKITAEYKEEGLNILLKKDGDCLQEKKIPMSLVPISYERESYIGYICPGGASGRIFLRPTNNVGGVKIELTKNGASTPFVTKILQKNEVHKGASFDLVGSASDPIPNRITAKITDLECQNFSVERLALYDLPSPDVIESEGQQRKYCVGDEIKLRVATLGEPGTVTYTWILPDHSTVQGQNLHIPSATAAHSGEYTMKVGSLHCGGTPSDIEIKFFLSVAPRELWWRKDATDANWHNLDNWAEANGASIQAVPAPCTTVHIPGVVDKAYPNLDGSITQRDVYGAPECDKIYMHYGAQLGQPQQLTYSRAYIDYNFGIVATDGSITYHKPSGHETSDQKLMERNRWYMIAAPLKDILSGDFGLAGYPKTKQRYLKIATVPSAPTDVSFRTPIASLVEPLAGHNNAMALRVGGYDTGKIGYKDHKNLNTLKGIIRLPFFDDANRPSSISLHFYNSARRQSRFFYFGESTLIPLQKHDDAIRSEHAHRFIFEQDNLKRIGSIMVEGITTEGYALSLSEGTHSAEWMMLGNPFMTPIDFDKLYEVNKNVIEPYYYIFENNAWKVYYKGGGVSSLSKEIAPLQSIVVRHKQGDNSGQLLFPTTSDKSVLLPSWRMGQAEIGLRSSEVEASRSPLTFHVTDAEQHTSSASLLWSGEVSAPALSNSEYGTAPTLFIVDPESKERNAIEMAHHNFATFPIGVQADLGGTMTLRCDAIDLSVYEELVLEDRRNGSKHNLLQEPEYSFIHNPGQGETRFLLHVKRVGVPNLDSEECLTPEVEINLRRDVLLVSSSSAMAKVVAYDMQGRKLHAVANNTKKVTIPIEGCSPIVILEVVFVDGSRLVRKVYTTSN